MSTSTGVDPAPGSLRLSECAFVGGGWAVTAAGVYALGLGVVVALADRSGRTPDSVNAALAVAVPAAVIGVLVAIPLGLLLGLVLGAVLRRRPRSPRGGALVGAAVALVGTAPLVGLQLWKMDPGLVLYLGVLPALVGAGAAALMGRRLSKQLSRAG